MKSMQIEMLKDDWLSVSNKLQKYITDLQVLSVAQLSLRTWIMEKLYNSYKLKRNIFNAFL